MADERASLTGSRPMLGARVLLVDDEAGVRRAFERVLASGGYTIETAEDGESALAAISRQEFDVVLSDLSLPGVHGIDLLRRIRENDLDLPVILITGNPRVYSAAQAAEYGAMRYLVKPVEPDDLRKAVEQAVRLRQFARLRRELVAFTGKSGKQIADRAGLEVRFDNALARLYFVYQPIVEWSSRSVIGYEAFVRSSEPTLAQALALFDTAERVNGLHRLGRAIRAGCGRVFEEATPDMSLFVNLHARDLDDDALFARDMNLSSLANRVVFELSERARLEQVKDVPLRVKELKSRGFRIAIDDIGAGYAGITAFTVLEPDLVKLDVELVRDVDRVLDKRRLIGSMIEVCHDLDIQVVAEGVETRAELETLIELGCNLVQGYLFARPAPRLPEIGLDWTSSIDPAASA